jgi:hypothetical protein
MTFEIGNGYGCYCDLDDVTKVEPFRSSISIKLMKDRRSLTVESDPDEAVENSNCKTKANKQMWFLVSVYSIAVTVIIVEYLVFFVAKR